MPARVRRLKTFEEQSPEQAREHMDGQEEARPAGEPALAVRERAAGHETVDMRVVGERLPPGVENGEEADLAAQMPRVGRNGLERRGHGIEQDRIDRGLVVEGYRRDFGRHREHDMEVWHRQQIGLTVRKPPFALGALALGTMPVAAGVIRDPAVRAVLARLDVTAEGCGPAELDR